MAMQLPSSSSSFSSAFTYQVFLSFRGTDTRHGFTGNLYKALTDKGIKTFIDDNDLQRGDEITPSLLKAIEESRIFIPVFSINYATSKFCLDELVHIIHCYKTKGRLVLPVFFGVDPTNVRHHTGPYGEALAGHEKRFQNDKDNMERLHQWKLALTQAANLSGYHSSPGYEYKFIGDIVKYISNKISRQHLHVANYPVGLQSRVQQVKSLLGEGYDNGVRMVGLYGTGGLASNKLKHLQEELLLKALQLKIKLGGVSEGIPYIKERLHTKKTLLILDDVDDMEQLHALAGGPDWFGRGSRVIITTRDKHLLRSHGIEKENVIFTDPHRGYRNTSLSQFEPPLKKQRLVEVVVSETEIWQQQHLALLSLQQQMALLPQQQRITVLSGMWNLVLSETKQSTSKKKHAEVGVSETEILQQQHLALVSGMQNLVLTETNEEHLC
ncbi:toll-interleukin-resistance (TIR) domain protein [Medicago truncatula]|uniref:Toll-interleukin-resistance (TIR) domain protein n=1 Tax=Medicago truncatula TaxID=3880 RepID=A0A072UB76_MEDTR|nr:toll-interleukin-resistance (TIR) domain protein [Medicago truncatula]